MVSIFFSLNLIMLGLGMRIIEIDLSKSFLDEKAN